MTLTEKAGRHTKRKRKKEMLIFPNRKVKPKIKMIVMIFKNKGTALCRQRLKFTGGDTIIMNIFLIRKTL